MVQFIAIVLLMGTPTPTPGSFAVLAGQMDPQILRHGVLRHVFEYQACYRHELLRVPELAGDLTIRFEIGTDGRGHGAESLRSTLHNDAAEQCVCGVFDRMTFPAPASPVTVTFPLRFSYDPLQFTIER